MFSRHLLLCTALKAGGGQAEDKPLDASNDPRLHHHNHENDEPLQSVSDIEDDRGDPDDLGAQSPADGPAGNFRNPGEAHHEEELDHDGEPLLRLSLNPVVG